MEKKNKEIHFTCLTNCIEFIYSIPLFDLSFLSNNNIKALCIFFYKYGKPAFQTHWQQNVNVDMMSMIYLE